MPFTVTHLAAILPFRKLPTVWLPFSALAIGSMVPDLPIFFDVGSSHTDTHTWLGLITRCLPLGLIIYLIFQTVVRTPLLEVIPSLAAQKLGTRKPHSPVYLLRLVVALLLGALTHVVWDAFTHAWQWGTELIPGMHKVFTIFGYRIRGYSLLQHGSSIVFIPLLAYLLYRYCKKPASPRSPAVTHTPYVQQLDFSWRTKSVLLILMFVAPALWSSAEAWFTTRSFYYGIDLAARAYGTYMMSTTLFIAIALQIMLWQLPRK